jgi:hypothetical protein
VTTITAPIWFFCYDFLMMTIHRIFELNVSRLLRQSMLLGLAFLLVAFLMSVAVPPAGAAKRSIAIKGETVMAPVKLPGGKIRLAEVTVYTVIPDAKFVEAACAYRITVRDAALYALKAQPMTLEDWGKLERGSQDARLSQAIKQYVNKPWINHVHAVAGTRARPKYTVWYDKVRVLRCADWERWKTREPPPPPPMFSEPIFKQFRSKKK